MKNWWKTDEKTDEKKLKKKDKENLFVKILNENNNNLIRNKYLPRLNYSFL